MLEGQPAVLGPSKDGGYYLIGFNKPYFSQMVFENIAWSTPKVLDQTLKIMKRVQLVPGLLPVLNDVDTPEDVKNLIEIIKRGGFVGPKTQQVLMSNGC